MKAGREKINWNEQFKLRISNADKSRQKHEVIKLLVMMKIIEKHKADRVWIRLYSEFPLENTGLIPDVYYENLKEKSVICYEIQKDLSNDYINRKTKEYNNYEIPFFTVDLIVIPLLDSPDNLTELNTWLDKFIV
jgi:hypothetical protein